MDEESEWEDSEEWEDEDGERIIFPQFYSDIPILIDKGIIKPVDADSPLDRYHWTKSKTSLAEYFKWIGKKETNVRGGFWYPVEKIFWIKEKPIKRGTLSRLASHNANSLKPEESEDFQEIKNLVLQYRKQLKIFHAIKRLILQYENEYSENIQTTLDKIKAILS